jgi:hypothetical protein
MLPSSNYVDKVLRFLYCVQLSTGCCASCVGYVLLTYAVRTAALI